MKSNICNCTLPYEECCGAKGNVDKQQVDVWNGGGAYTGFDQNFEELEIVSMQQYFIVQIESLKFEETDVIGVTDSREGAIKMINEYFGEDINREVVEEDLRIVEEGGVDSELRLSDEEGHEYNIGITYHQLNQL